MTPYFYPPVSVIKNNGNITALDFYGNTFLSEPIGIDDSILINKALALGETRLVEGTYIIKHTIIIPDNTTLSGEGWKTIITQPADTSIAIGGPMIIVNSGAVCKDLKIDGNAPIDNPLTNTNGVQLNKTCPTLYNCEVQNVRQYAVWSYKGVSPKVINCKIHGCLYPISFTGDVLESNGWCNGGIAYGNYTYDAKLYNKIRCAKNCQFSHNHVVLSIAGGDGIVCSGADGPYKNISIKDNILENLLESRSGIGILTQDDANSISKNIIIDGNVLSGKFAYTIIPRARNTIVGNNIIPEV